MDSQIDKITALNGLAEEIRGCNKCELCTMRKNAVVGEGNPYTDIVFIGEAPGRIEDETGRPFVGNAGKFLDSMLNAAGLSREDVFITNVIKDRPPENRDPKPEEIANCQAFLERQIEIINPKIIVTLGRFSMNLFLPGVKISKVHGIPYIKRDGRVYVPMYHPAATLHQPSLKEVAIKDMLKLPKIIEILEKGIVTEESDKSVTLDDIAVPELQTEEEELADIYAFVNNTVEEQPEDVTEETAIEEPVVEEEHVVINRPHMRCFDPYFFAMSIPEETEEVNELTDTDCTAQINSVETVPNEVLEEITVTEAESVAVNDNKVLDNEIMNNEEVLNSDIKKDEEAYISEMIENASNNAAILDTELEYVADDNMDIMEEDIEEENLDEYPEDEIITEICDTNKFQLKLFDA